MRQPWSGLLIVSAWLLASISLPGAAERCTRNLDGPTFPVRAIGPGPALEPLERIDIDQDGTTDRLVLERTGAERRIKMLSYGPGPKVLLRDLLTLTPAPSWAPDRHAFADFDGDGTIDLLDLPQNGVILYRGLGDGQFAAGELDTTVWVHRTPTVGDVDGDGRVELVAPVSVTFGWQLRIHRWDAEGGWVLIGSAIPRAPREALWGGDFNGDGLFDVAYRLEDTLQPRIDVLLGDRAVPLGQALETQLPADLELHGVIDGGDGRDVLIGRRLRPFGEVVRLDWFADPNPRLVERWRHPLPKELSSTRPRIEDLDGDGWDDLWFTFGSNEPAGFLLLRCGPQACDTTTRDLASERAIDLRDLDHDGTRELIFSQPREGIGFLRGIGELHFSDSRVAVEKPVGIGREWGGDFDEDGQLDLITWNSTGAAPVYQLQLGDGAGEFTAQAMPQPPSPLGLSQVLDLDADGHLDLIALASGTARSAIALAWGRGDATFEEWATQPIDHTIVDLTWADLDGDRTLDLAIDVRLSLPSTGRETQFSLLQGRQLVATGVVRRDSVNPVDGLADVDGDGQLDLIGNRPVRTGPAAGQEQLEWIRLIAGRPGAAQVYSAERFDRIDALAAGDLDGDGLADLFIHGTSGGEHRVLHGDGGKGQASTIWQGPRLENSAPDRLEDLDGDGIRDLVTGAGAIRFRRGDGAGSFGPVEGGWIRGGFGVLLGDIDGGGTVDLLVTGDAPAPAPDLWIWHPASGTVAPDDTAAPILRFTPLPFLVDLEGRPGWSGQWRIAARAIDDCRSARVTSIRLRLEPAVGFEQVTFTASSTEEIGIARAADGSTRVALRGPERSRLERWLADGRAAGVELARNHLMRLEEHDEPGAPLPEFPASTVLQHVTFEAGLPSRVDSYAPSPGIAFALEGSDWLGKRSSRVETFSAARSEFCAGAGAISLACD